MYIGLCQENRARKGVEVSSWKSRSLLLLLNLKERKRKGEDEETKERRISHSISSEDLDSLSI